MFEEAAAASPVPQPVPRSQYGFEPADLADVPQYDDEPSSPMNDAAVDTLVVPEEELKAIPSQLIDRCSSPTPPDVLMGAYMLEHMRMHCEQCGTSDTPQWRKGWDSPLTQKPVMLCNACGLKYAKKQNCPYCNFIYRREDERHTVNKWIGCAACPRWVHAECELRNGGHIARPGTIYLCPDCRIQQPQLWGLTPAFAS